MKTAKPHSCVLKNSRIRYRREEFPEKKTISEIPQREVVDTEEFHIEIQRKDGIITAIEIKCACGGAVAMNFSYPYKNF